MTIFRCEAVSLALLLLSSPALAQESGQWSMTYSDGEELHKLFFVPPGASHGQVYMRCRTGDGWIFLIHNEPAGRKAGYTPQIKAGDAQVSPSFYLDQDEVGEGFYFDAALPAQSRIFDNLGKGSSLQIDGKIYPVRSEKERATIRSFQYVCGGQS